MSSQWGGDERWDLEWFWDLIDRLAGNHQARKQARHDLRRVTRARRRMWGNPTHPQHR